MGDLYRDILEKIKNLLTENEGAEEKIDDDLIKELANEVNFEKA